MLNQELQRLLDEVNINEKKALLFDCDGTLADTMPAHNKAYELAFALNGVPFDLETHERFAPLGGKILIEETVTKQGFAGKEQDIIRDKQKLLPICLDKFMVVNEDLIKLIKEKHDTHFIAVVSNGRRNSIEKILEALGIRYHINLLVTSDILVKAKPHPEAYKCAMANLGVTPEEVIVFEDNEIGFESAYAAGIQHVVEVQIENE